MKGDTFMKKKILALLAATSLSMFALTGCGEQTPTASGDLKQIKVGATPVPHAEMLEQIKDDLKNDGVALEIVEFNDYVQPQHQPYLDDFVKEHQELKLTSAGGIHIEPMGIYSKKIQKLEDLADGATVSIPNDPTNGGRALLLLEKAGLLKLKEGVGEKATPQDIVENSKNLQIQELEAAQVPRTLEDVDIAIINTNFAMQVNLVPTKDALFMEDSTSPYVNIVAVRQGDENRDEIKALMKELKSDKIKKFIEEKYKGEVVPAF